MEIGQGQNLYSHLVLRSTFFFFYVTTRNETIGKELKWRGGGEAHKRRKIKMQRKSDLQVSIQKQKKRQGTLGKWGKGFGKLLSDYKPFL